MTTPLTPSAGALPIQTRRTGGLMAAVIAAVVLLLGAAPQPAQAHPLSTSAVFLDVDSAQVQTSVQLPLDELASALKQPLTASTVLRTPTVTAIEDYVHEHMSAAGDDGTAWTTTISGATVRSIDGVDQLVLSATLAPSSGTVGGFTLTYDAILDKISSHRIFVLAREGSTGDYTTLAMLSFQRQSVPVRATEPKESHGFLPAVHLGIDHISRGSDHLLFLIMLLLPAPLIARGHRWARRDDLRRASWRVVHVVTAFAIGHSITLALGAAGLIHLPSRAVESGIALSVLVSAIHAVRPLVRGGELLIAGSFGLLHGLAFAALINELGLSRGGLVLNLLGFNLGIELTQLAVVALVMPSLMVLSRTRAYPVIRTATAGLGGVLSGLWLIERLGLIARNPLEPVADLLITHPLLIAAGLAGIAAASVSAPRLRVQATQAA